MPAGNGVAVVVSGLIIELGGLLVSSHQCNSHPSDPLVIGGYFIFIPLFIYFFFLYIYLFVFSSFIFYLRIFVFVFSSSFCFVC